MRGRGYVQLDADTIEQARQMDLLTYMKMFEPDNLVHLRGNIYSTREHDSLKISNGKWYWWSRGFGGYTALDYLIKVRGFHFLDAIATLTGSVAVYDKPVNKDEEVKKKSLLLPPKNKDTDKVKQYLLGRSIDEKILDICIEKGLIYESADYHNAVFVGVDEKGSPRYAAVRSVYTDFKNDASGSDKQYSFRLLAKEPTDTVHLFESAIDLLSYATYLKYEEREYENENLISLSGVYQPKKELGASKIPIAVAKFLKDNPTIGKIFIHFDNDMAGRLAAKTLKLLLEKEYTVYDRAPPAGKDVNDYLNIYLGRTEKKRTKNADMCR